MTSGLLQSVHTKNKLYKQHKIKNNDEASRKYKLYNNKLEHLKRIAKKSYYTNEINKYKSDPKNMWNIIKSIINRKNKKPNLPDHFQYNNKYLTNLDDIANNFNKYFATIGSSLNALLPPPSHDCLKYMKSPIINSMFLFNTNKPEIQKIIKTLKNNSLLSSDIKVSLVKHVSEEISEYLCKVIDTIFSTGKFPDFLKMAVVTPVYKSGDNSLFSNYRPISVLPVLSKLVERCLFNRLISFINKNNLLTDRQFGFRKSHSTIHALTYYYDKLSELLEDNLYVISTFIDLSKAFDTINHDILLKKLSYYGIRGICLDLLKSYLSNRLQKVKIAKPDASVVFSRYTGISCGVPQGSILGPLLFLLYINDMPAVSSKLDFVLFADDTTITGSSRNLLDLQNIFNVELNLLHNWLVSNKLTINTSKTNYILFTPKNKVIAFTPFICVQDNEISQVTSIKFLGIIIDNKLSWNLHITYLANKLAKNMSILYKLKGSFPQSTMLNMYYSFIYSLLTYGISIWGNSSKSNLNKLITLQKQAVRIICDTAYRAHTDSLFKTLKILKLQDIFLLEVLKFTYKFKLGILPTVFHDYFTISETQVRQETFHIPRHRTNYRAASIKILGAKKFNQFHKKFKVQLNSINNLKKFFILNTLSEY